jgi:HKD family nuclease
LDDLAQQSVVIATANSMNISVDFVTFVSSSVSTDQILNKNNMKIKLSSYNLIVTTKTNIILQGKYSVFLSNPQLLFTTLSTSMTNLGIFTHNLVTISLQLNSTATASAIISSVYVSNPIIQTNNTNNTNYFVTHMPSFLFTLKPTTTSKNSGKENYNSSLLIIFVSCVSVFVGLIIFYIVYLFFKRRFLRRNQDNANLLNIDKIEIKFC